MRGTGIESDRMGIKKKRSGLSFTPSYIGTPEGVRLHFCPCGGQAKIAVATRICTDRSNMPPAYCDFDLRVPASRCKRKRRGEFFIHSVLYWYAGRDSNPQPSEPESDALSIEPPAHSSIPRYYSTNVWICKEQKQNNIPLPLGVQRSCISSGAVLQ